MQQKLIHAEYFFLIRYRKERETVLEQLKIVIFLIVKCKCFEKDSKVITMYFLSFLIDKNKENLNVLYAYL